MMKIYTDKSQMPPTLDFNTAKVGDRVKVVGMGAPGFAQLGDILEITKVEPNKVYAKRADGEEAFFALTCGASRLQPLPTEPKGASHE